MVALVVLVGSWCGIDALIVTDEERLERFVEHVTGTIDADRLGLALEWVDPAAEPIEVTARGNMEVYDDEATLRSDALRALRPFIGEELRPLHDAISVEDDTATISLRLFITNRGIVDVDFRLHRRGDTWLVNRVVVR